MKYVCCRLARFFCPVVLTFAVVFGQVSLAQEPSGGVHEMSERDSLRALAEKYFGGEQFLPELLGFNHITDPLSVGPGDLVALPGVIREQALAGIVNAEQALSVSVAAGADTYAKEEYAKSQQSLHEAEQARKSAVYQQALALSRVSLLWAEKARARADATAPVQQDGKITSVVGVVETSSGDGQRWEKVSASDPLPVKAILRTAAGARAEITLADGSVVQVLESTQFQLQDFIYDRRDGRRVSRLKVHLGNILGKIKPREVEASKFTIDSKSAVVGIRGTELRVGADEAGVARISMLEGATTVSASGIETSLEKHFGTFVEENMPPIKPVPLLPPPEIMGNDKSSRETAEQILAVQWQKPGSKRVGEYHFELATDPLFNEIVTEQVSRAPKFESPILSKGIYYWRVATLDKDGLEGPPTGTYTLTIVPNLELAVHPSAGSFDVDEKPFFGPNVMFNIRPRFEDTSVVDWELSLNGAPFESIKKSFRLKDHGKNVIKARGRGADGSYGDEISYVCYLDANPPDIDAHLDTGVQDPELGRVTVITLDASDDTGVGRIEYSVDGQAYEAYTDPIKLSAARPADVRFRSVDGVGNRSETLNLHVLRDMDHLSSDYWREEK